MLNFECSLYILATSPLLDTWFANSFCQSVACLFILLTGFFKEQNFSIWVKSSISVFPFMDHAFVVKSKKNSLPSLGIKDFLYAFF